MRERLLRRSVVVPVGVGLFVAGLVGLAVMVAVTGAGTPARWGPSPAVGLRIVAVGEGGSPVSAVAAGSPTLLVQDGLAFVPAAEAGAVNGVVGFLVAPIEPARAAQWVARLRALGIGTRTAWGDPPADSGAARFSLTEAGRGLTTASIRGFGSVTAGQGEGGAENAAVHAAVEEFAAWVRAQGRPVEAQRFFRFARPWTDIDNGGLPEVSWPAGPLDQGSEAYSLWDPGWRCEALDETATSTVRAALAGRPLPVLWRDRGAPYRVLLRPALPGESTCGDVVVPGYASSSRRSGSGPRERAA